ncbi:MAG: type II toxin-antitoxin system HigB family toxin [Fibrobacteres bacterium]|nr:type II toxin-antitoxin system HigB family toxin [Fibrobacterota bacterium]
MRVIAIRTLKEFWQKPGNQDAEQALRAWYAEAKEAEWTGPNDIKAKYLSASIVGSSRVVFNIKGNKYRLIVAIKYDFKIAYIRFVGGHKEYDAIDARTI